MDSYDIWTFDDHLRADVKGSLKVDSKQLTLTGMALGLNSTISIKEYGKQLPSCPMLLLSNSEGVLQVYYFIHEQFQSICRAPEVIKQIQVGNILGTSTSSALPIVPSRKYSTLKLLTNGSLTTSASTPIALQPKEKTNLINTFGFNQQTVNGSSMNDFSKPMTMNLDTKTISTQQPPIKSVMNNEQSSTPMIDSKKFLQMVDQFQSKLSSLGKSIPKSSTTQNDSNDPLNNLKKMLTDMTTSYQKSMQSIKTMTSEHIESVTKIENARYQLRLSQKENLYHSLKDRELDPWTQSRLDSIKTKYDQLKHNLNVLLQVTHTTIHDTSLLDASDDAENEYFLPDLKISLNTSQTMKQRMQNRICELSHKVTETERDLEKICSALNNDILSSKTFDKTTMSSERPFHTLDAQILAHLQATHKSITQVIVPPAVGINISSTVESLKKQTPIEILKPKTPLIQPSAALQQPNTPSAESESFKNMLRIVRTSIDLFSGVTSPEQLQELSNTIATSPLATTQRSNTTSMPKTPTTTKTTTLIKTPTILKPQQQAAPILQTPAKSITSPVPTISVTPATPATQSLSSNTPLSFVQAKPVVPTLTDQTKSQTSSAANDSAIRSLLNSTVSPQTNVTSVTNQLGTVITPNQVAPMAAFSNSTSLNQTASFPSPSATSTSSAVTVASPSSTVTTSVQSTSPTTKPLISAGSISASIPFGSSSMAPTTTASTGQLFGGTSATAASIPSPFGSGFSTPSSPAPVSTGSPFGGGGTTATTTSAPTTGIFGNPSTSTSSPFGTAGNSTVTTAAPTAGFFSTPTTAQASPFGSTTTTSTTGAFGTTATTAAPQTGIFGGTTNPSSSPFGAATSTAASTTGIFGGGGGFGSSGSTSSPFGGSFTSTPSTSVASPFGSSGFGTTSSAPTNSVFGGFGSTSTAPTSTSTTGGFGISSSTSSPTSSTGFGSGPSFGGNFSGFNTQSKSSGSSTGFTFGGFSGASSNTAAPQQTFASFGSPTSATSPPAASPFGGSMFGGSSMTQSTGFSTTGSTFGASAAQSPTSGSFSAYRK
ncbi:hypothetical protein I4U23_013906 [Adineta vaga]|nr:hypothetical protein I4U23_013906 [Adineta vaga]